MQTRQFDLLAFICLSMLMYISDEVVFRAVYLLPMEVNF
jgi:hypothetical protein